MSFPVYLSIVIVARNDNYGGNFIQRVTLFSDMLRYQAEKHPDLFELIVINWNPLSDRISIADAVDWTMAANVRVITVPGTIHDQIVDTKTMPVLEYFGKNVGISRAHGEYVLVTNPDIILSDELFEFIATKELSENRFYRTDRYDFHEFNFSNISALEKRQKIKENVFKVFYRNGIQDTEYISEKDIIKTDIFEEEELLEDGTILNKWIVDTPVKMRGKSVHNYASGDFILTSKSIFSRLKGFSERTDTFTHLDTIITFRLRALNVPQVILRYPRNIFHMDHGRTEQVEKPNIDERDLWQLLLSALSGGDSEEYANRSNWGLRDHVLDERLIERQ